MLSSAKIEELSQNSFVLEVVKFKNCGNLPKEKKRKERKKKEREKDR
jgi:hypothetical protein